MPATKFPEIFTALAAPFEPAQVRTRAQAGRQLSYISARTAMNRLDTVLGPENWRDEYAETREGLRCRIWFRVPGQEEWSWKEDGGAGAGMAEADNEEKSAYSDAFKRAAVKLGVGRYLYQDGLPSYGVDAEPPARSQPGMRAEPEATKFGGNAPRSGRALFAWTKEMEQKHDVGLLKYLDRWSKLQGFPDRMVDWDAEQVALAHAEAVLKLESIPGSNPQSGMSPEPNHAPPASDPPQARGTGKDLYNEANRKQSELGVTLVGPLIAWAKEQGIAGSMAEWKGRDLAAGWQQLAIMISAIGKPGDKPQVKFAGLKREIVAKATELVKTIHGLPGEPQREQVQAKIDEVYDSLYQGEVIPSLKDFDDEPRLHDLLKCLIENLEDAVNAASL